jgi:hypothetical protein
MRGQFLDRKKSQPVFASCIADHVASILLSSVKRVGQYSAISVQPAAWQAAKSDGGSDAARFALVESASLM